MAAKKQVGKYEIGRTLGEGTFGKVKHAVHVSSRVEVAIKVLDKERIQKLKVSVSWVCGSSNLRELQTNRKFRPF